MSLSVASVPVSLKRQEERGRRAGQDGPCERRNAVVTLNAQARALPCSARELLRVDSQRYAQAVAGSPVASAIDGASSSRRQLHSGRSSMSLTGPIADIRVTLACSWGARAYCPMTGMSGAMG